MKRMFFMLAAATTLLFSCSKDKDNGDKSPVIPAVNGKKLAQTDINYPTTFAYNANGTIKEASYQAWGTTYKRSYKYEGNLIKYETTNMTSGKNGEIGTYTLTNGKVTTFSWWTCNAGGDPIWNFNETLTYNAKGLLETHTLDGGASRKFYYDANNNLVKKEYYNAQAVLEGETVYTYFDKEDKFPWFGKHDVWFFHFVVPPFSKQVLKSRTLTSYLDPADNNMSTYTYEFDANGYIVKGTEHYVMGQQANDYEWHNVFE